VTRYSALRRFRLSAAAWLVLATVFCPIAARAGDMMSVGHRPVEPVERGVVYGLTAKELVLAAAIGGVIGATTGMVQNGLTAGAAAAGGVGVLTAIWIGHFVAEAIFVGGLWYFWPEPDPPDTHGTIGPISHVTRVSGLGMAASPR
jgi:hypothetical protein